MLVSVVKTKVVVVIVFVDKVDFTVVGLILAVEDILAIVVVLSVFIVVVVDPFVVVVVVVVIVGLAVVFVHSIQFLPRVKASVRPTTVPITQSTKKISKNSFNHFGLAFTGMLCSGFVFEFSISKDLNEV